jgi:peptidyl-prolyl cis-trans isomerase A (cyclophilin A)
MCLALAAAMAAAASAQTKTPEKTAAPAKTTAAAKPAPNKAGAAPAAYNRALLTPARLSGRGPDTYDVKFETTRGDFVVRVTRLWAPRGADRFYHLVKNGFYNNASFFRVLPGFMAQFGISAYPEVNSAWENARIKDDPVTQPNKRGKITFATSGPNTRTTQVFINFSDRNVFLDGQGFSPFGEVIQGMNVVDMFYEGYGEGAPQGRGPRQDLIGAQGKAYLDKGFPKLDYIKSATIVSSSGEPAPPAKAGAPAKSTAPAKTPAKTPAKPEP